jgi:hypothetical protein
LAVFKVATTVWDTKAGGGSEGTATDDDDNDDDDAAAGCTAAVVDPESLSDLLGIEAASRTATVEGTAVAAIAVECSAVVAIVVVAAAAEPAVTSEDTPSVIATNGITSATKKVQLKGI